MFCSSRTVQQLGAVDREAREVAEGVVQVLRRGRP